jgi:undecaprenyl diphosphate synthase
MTQINLPRHIAIVMDGNGRWAKQRFMPRVAGHRAGVEAARQVVKNCRPAQEVSYLMELFLKGLEREVSMLHDNNIQLRFIGDRTRFSEKLVSKIKEVEQLTLHNTGMVLLIAADYGGQWDITQAVQKLTNEIKAGQLTSAEITPAKIAEHLSFADLPNPDLFIRTSGELRLSNFMLWQLAYTELYFTPTYWPDFNEQELDKALDHFSSRERRYGKSGEQLQEGVA